MPILKGNCRVLMFARMPACEQTDGKRIRISGINVRFANEKLISSGINIPYSYSWISQTTAPFFAVGVSHLFRSRGESLKTRLTRDWNLLANWPIGFRGDLIFDQSEHKLHSFNSFRPLSRGLRYFDFVSFGPHCLFFVFLYFIPNHSTQNVCKRYLLFYKVLRRYRRIRIQVRTVDMFV